MVFLPSIKHCIRNITAPLFRWRRKMPVDIEYICAKVNNLPDGLKDCKVAVVADLHIPDNLVDITQLLVCLQEQKPDVILLAGDLTNRYNAIYPAETSAFLQQAAAIAPVFAIAGNHECVASHLPSYEQLLQDTKTTFLKDALASFECKDEKLYIYGVCDPCTPLPTNLPFPTILLIHYPELAVKADKSGCICAVCGHAHGGQVRFGKRGLFSPGQGFFPQYISGKYDVNGFPVIVSRGLGDSSLPIRIKNRPHLPIIILE